MKSYGSINTELGSEISTTPEAPSISSGTLVIDCSKANIFIVSHNANITTLTVSNATDGQFLYIAFNEIGNGNTISWPGNFTFLGNTTLDAVNGHINIVEAIFSSSLSTWIATLTNDVSGGGAGSVTSVALSDGSSSPIYSISGSPISTAGTLTFTLASQTANKVFAGPTSGSNQPAFRALVVGDIPSGLSYVTSIGVSSAGASSGALTIGSSPVTSSGTITITPNLFSTSTTTAGVVPGANSLGSTYYLDGSGSWSIPGGGGGGGAAGGSNTQVQFNSSGLLAGDPGFTYVGSSTQTLTLGTSTTSPTIAATQAGSGGGTTLTINGSAAASSSGTTGGLITLTGGNAGTSGGIATHGTVTGGSGYVATQTLSGVAISATTGKFTCTAATRTLAINQTVTISGTKGGGGTITGYTDPTTYFIIATTNGSTDFTLSTTQGGAAITTTTGTPTGLTYTDANGTNTTTYTAVPLTGGTGTGAIATISTVSGAVTTVTITTAGTGYTVGDTLSASNTNLGGVGSGFSVPVSTTNGSIGGGVTVTGGVGTNISAGGTVSLNGGATNPGALTNVIATAGAVNIVGGISTVAAASLGSTTTVQGGGVSITGGIGTANGTNTTGGPITITGGAGTINGVGNVGGGSVNITGGASNTSAGTAGTVQIAGGNSAGTGGSVNIFAGPSTGTSNPGGTVTIGSSLINTTSATGGGTIITGMNAQAPSVSLNILPGALTNFSQPSGGPSFQVAVTGGFAKVASVVLPGHVLVSGGNVLASTLTGGTLYTAGQAWITGGQACTTFGQISNARVNGGALVVLGGQGTSNTTPSVTLAGVSITGTAGQFQYTGQATQLAVGQTITISGTLGGTGTISGYTNPTTYFIVATNGAVSGTGTFTLSTTLGGTGVTTTTGTPTGLTYTFNTATVGGVLTLVGGSVSTNSTGNGIAGAASLTGGTSTVAANGLGSGYSVRGGTVTITGGASVGNGIAVTSANVTISGGTSSVNGAVAGNGGSVTIATGLATGTGGTAGSLTFNTGTTTSVLALTINSAGAVLANTTSGVGYGTGSGGSVTQTTSRSTGVTLNTPTGAITLVSAAGSATFQSFVVASSSVAVTDVVHVCQKSGTDLYQIFVTNVGSGTFQITYATTGGTTTEQPVFNFVVIKGSTN